MIARFVDLCYHYLQKGKILLSEMNMENCVTMFDQLSTEIFLEIFDYLSSNEILYTFFDLNERFRAILHQYQRCISHLETPKDNFYFWERIFMVLSEQIQCLTISTGSFNFSLNIFPNLKSVIISSSCSLNYQRLYFLLKSKQFTKLESFGIQRNPHFTSTITEHVEVDVDLCSNIFYYGKISWENIPKSIHYLIFRKFWKGTDRVETSFLISTNIEDRYSRLTLQIYTLFKVFKSNYYYSNFVMGTTRQRSIFSSNELRKIPCDISRFRRRFSFYKRTIFSFQILSPTDFIIFIIELLVD